MEETNEDKGLNDADPSFTVVTDVSLPSSMNDLHEDTGIVNSKSIDLAKFPKFELNLANIKVDESSDNEDE